MDELKSFNPFSVCFNILKMKYKDYDDDLTAKNFLVQEDKINVFINLETVFKHLSMLQNLEEKIISFRGFDEIMISEILNLVAHYKKFFCDNGLENRIYIYNTDLKSTEFNQLKYNEDYRSYYLEKFNGNPKFILLTERLTGKILPDVRTYCEFLPNVYYISSKNIEGSLVPYIIAQSDTSRKNLIIGGELYDTQYSFLNNYVNHYIHRGFGCNAIYSEVGGYLKDMTKKDDNVNDMSSMYNNYRNYSTLISVMGDKSRSISGLTGYGPRTLQKVLTSGVQENLIQDTTTNPELIGSIFHDKELKTDFINNFYCSSIVPMYQELTKSEIISVLSQQVDRTDINTIQALNRTKFCNYPIFLDTLLLR